MPLIRSAWPWAAWWRQSLVPTFDAGLHRDHLVTIQAEIVASGSFTVTSHRILLVAVRNQ